MCLLLRHNNHQKRSDSTERHLFLQCRWKTICTFFFFSGRKVVLDCSVLVHMQYTTIFVLCTTNTVNNYIHVAIATFRLRMRQTRIHGEKGRSLTMLTKFCPLLTTYLLTQWQLKGNYFAVIRGNMLFHWHFPVPPTLPT